MSKTTLGVCYYPEHWPETQWRDDVNLMREIGIEQVRIGEFSWSRIEPSPDEFSWAWLDRAIETIHTAGIRIILGTPTATPPKWLVDRFPDILAVDKNGRKRAFGSRRHYCFSSETYAREAERIVSAMTERYGKHQNVIAWQTDNEYGCHDTVRSYSPSACNAFREWLRRKYVSVDKLNSAWGTVFWSQEYRDFGEVDFPNLTVTEANPSHKLDFFRFSSDQVVAFNRRQTEIIRHNSPGRPIYHNAMGFFFDFDHFDLCKDLDGIYWDSYPLGFLDGSSAPIEVKQRYMRQGHPDFAGFHHDLYRGCGNGRWGVMEQQPGPVNWAAHNPAPLPGMGRLWAAEARAHGADAVNFFRWRQAPFAQEQMHAGLLRPDNTKAQAFAEANSTAKLFSNSLANIHTDQLGDVAILFDYQAFWLYEAQPQCAEWDYSDIVFRWYTAVRRHGLNIDFVAPGSDLSAYSVVIVPSLPVISDETVEALADTSAQIVVGARSGSKTTALNIPRNCAPGPLSDMLGLKIIMSETFPPFHIENGVLNGDPFNGTLWLDHVETALPPLIQSKTGHGLVFQNGRFTYVTTVPDEESCQNLISFVMNALPKQKAYPLPKDLRMRRCGKNYILFNYGPEPAAVPNEITHLGPLVYGENPIPAADFAIIADEHG
ncbi:MAG: beta-galactosidase [Pseudomonadota bacterium]